jgi:hypothetical protein
MFGQWKANDTTPPLDIISTGGRWSADGVRWPADQVCTIRECYTPNTVQPTLVFISPL